MEPKLMLKYECDMCYHTIKSKVENRNDIDSPNYIEVHLPYGWKYGLGLTLCPDCYGKLIKYCKDEKSHEIPF